MRKRLGQLVNYLWALVLASALMVLASIVGCGSGGGDRPPPVFYGPPPVDGGDGAPDGVSDRLLPDGGDGATTDAVADADRPPADGIDRGAPDGAECEPRVAYGPPPCTSDADCERYGAGWYCDREHPMPDGCGGSWTVCAPLDSGVPDSGVDGNDGLPPVFYGPPPIDSGVPDAGTDGGDGTPAVYYGPAPIDAGPGPDVRADCVPGAFYGPRPCSTDDECVTEHGAGWYCDRENAYDDGCGRRVVWPICRPRPDK